MVTPGECTSDPGHFGLLFHGRWFSWSTGWRFSIKFSLFIKEIKENKYNNSDLLTSWKDFKKMNTFFDYFLREMKTKSEGKKLHSFHSKQLFLIHKKTEEYICDYKHSIKFFLSILKKKTHIRDVIKQSVLLDRQKMTCNFASKMHLLWRRFNCLVLR